MLDRFYHDDITYWGIVSRDTFSSITFAAPVTFKGRWEDKTQQVMGPHGEVFVSKSSIHYPQTLAASVVIDGYMFKGVSLVPDPRDLVGAYQVKALSNVPDLRSLEQVCVALL